MSLNPKTLDPKPSTPTPCPAQASAHAALRSLRLDNTLPDAQFPVALCSPVGRSLFNTVVWLGLQVWTGVARPAGAGRIDRILPRSKRREAACTEATPPHLPACVALPAGGGGAEEEGVLPVLPEEGAARHSTSTPRPHHIHTAHAAHAAHLAARSSRMARSSGRGGGSGRRLRRGCEPRAGVRGRRGRPRAGGRGRTGLERGRWRGRRSPGGPPRAARLAGEAQPSRRGRQPHPQRRPPRPQLRGPPRGPLAQPAPPQRPMRTPRRPPLQSTAPSCAP
jgi:hypothetical protein